LTVLNKDYINQPERLEANMQVWFKKCGCHILREPHGYFHDSVKGRCRTPTLSLESGKMALDGILKTRRLSAKSVAKILAQLQDAGLPKRCGTDERVAALFVQAFFQK
jgi:hypothetical protein